MNKDLIETPRFNFFIGDEVLLKGKIVGFDVDENKCVENGEQPRPLRSRMA
ncbi:Uncharacterised protein [Streptococcus pneumoniae]|nr:Uncharacterised protein [Streptococcus pneumoniae]VQF07628.1 Uncharacterised protein [Streptococcus pneumoniae]